MPCRGGASSGFLPESVSRGQRCVDRSFPEFVGFAHLRRICAIPGPKRLITTYAGTTVGVVMSETEFLDVVRYGHLLSVALGLGVAISADVQVVRSLTRPVTGELVRQIAQCHRMIWIALWGMWLTGLALVYLRTGFELSAFTPKLFAKLGIVGILTLNAMLMGHVGLPLLAGAEGQAPKDLPLAQKIVAGWLGAISTTSWLMALALGSSTALKTAGWSVFSVTLPVGYMLAIAGATMAIIALHALGSVVGQVRRLRVA